MAQVSVDAFYAFAPVIDQLTVWSFICLLFGNNCEMFCNDISVATTIAIATTIAKAEGETYIRFPISFPEDPFPGSNENYSTVETEICTLVNHTEIRTQFMVTV